MYCVQYQSITPRVWDTKNQTGRDSVWAGRGRGGRAGGAEGGRGGSGTGSSRGGEGAAAAAAAATVATTPVVTNTQRVSVCSDRRALTHATCRYNYGRKKSPRREGEGEKVTLHCGKGMNEMERAICGMIHTSGFMSVSLVPFPFPSFILHPSIPHSTLGPQLRRHSASGFAPLPCSLSPGRVARPR